MNKVKFTNEQLRNLLATHSIRSAAKVIGCSPSSVYRRATRLGLHSSQPPSYKTSWSDEKIEQLRELLKTHTVVDVAKIMGYYEGYLRKRIKRFGLRPEYHKIYHKIIWREKDEQLRNLLAAKHSLKEAAGIMGISKTRIVKRMKYLGLHSRCVWTKGDTDMLRKLYNGCNAGELAKLLGRTQSSVESKIHVEALAKVRPWTEEQDSTLRNLKGNKSIKETAHILLRSLDSVRKRAIALPEVRLWKKLHGKVPKFMYVDFVDGNPNNLFPDNLTLRVNKKHVALQMSMGNLPEIKKQLVEAYVQRHDLIEAQAALYEVHRTIRELENKKRKKEA